MIFIYEGCDATGNKISDSIEAGDEKQARELLRTKGLFVLSISEQGKSANQGSRNKSKTRISNGSNLKELTTFTRQLAILVSNGTPMIDALASIRKQTKNEVWKTIVADIYKRVEEGASLSEAISHHPRHFNPVSKSLIHAGESSGQMHLMLQRLADMVRQQTHIRSSFLGAMLYPLVLIVVSFLVVVMLVVFVMPRFTGLFETLDAPLPPTTKFLMVISTAIKYYWWLMLLGIGGVLTGIWAWTKRPKSKFLIDQVVLKIPRAGTIVRDYTSAKIARLLGMLISSHVPVLEALALTKASIQNTQYIKMMTQAEDAVTRGENISVAWENSELLNNSVVEAIKSGEETGNIGTTLLNIAGYLDEDNEVIIKSLTSIIEPIILVVLGIIVAIIALSMFLPLFDLTSMTGTQ